MNLDASDTIRKCNLMKAALDTTFEIIKLVKNSPCREQLFEDIKDEMSPGSPGVRVLCPTRWTVKADTMMSIIQNYTVLTKLWDKASEVVKDTETIARIKGVAAQCAYLICFFGLVLGEMLLRHSDNLSRAIQKIQISASEGQATASMTISTLLQLKKDEQFELFWKKVNAMAVERDVNEPNLPRQRK